MITNMFAIPTCYRARPCLLQSIRVPPNRQPRCNPPRTKLRLCSSYICRNWYQNNVEVSFIFFSVQLDLDAELRTEREREWRVVMVVTKTKTSSHAYIKRPFLTTVVTPDGVEESCNSLCSAWRWHIICISISPGGSSSRRNSSTNTISQQHIRQVSKLI